MKKFSHKKTVVSENFLLAKISSRGKISSREKISSQQNFDYRKNFCQQKYLRIILSTLVNKTAQQISAFYDVSLRKIIWESYSC